MIVIKITISKRLIIELSKKGTAIFRFFLQVRNPFLRISSKFSSILFNYYPSL